MVKTILFVIMAIFDFIMSIWVYLLISCFVGWLLCDIDSGDKGVWYQGIWHGLFIIPNFIRSWFGDALYKAETYTTAYNVFYWIFSILSVLGWFSGGSRRG